MHMSLLLLVVFAVYFLLHGHSLQLTLHHLDKDQASIRVQTKDRGVPEEAWLLSTPRLPFFGVRECSVLSGVPMLSDES